MDAFEMLTLARSNLRSEKIFRDRYNPLEELTEEQLWKFILSENTMFSISSNKILQKSRRQAVHGAFEQL